jgi:hypothetical protein
MMMIKMIALLMTVLCVSVSAAPKAPGPAYAQAKKIRVPAQETCKATPWPYSRTDSKEDLQALLNQLDRQSIVQYYFRELTQPGQPSLAVPLKIYLVATEQDEDLRNYYRLLAWAANLEETGTAPRVLPLKEICELLARLRAS